MALIDLINNDIKEAMKAKEKERLEALRAVKAELLLLKTAAGASDEISDADGVKLLQKMVKQRKESAGIYKEQNREDLYAQEMAQISYIQPYLPQQMTDDELTVAVREIIARVGATSAKELGKVMGVATKELAGKVEGKLISEKVKSLLA